MKGFSLKGGKLLHVDLHIVGDITLCKINEKPSDDIMFLTKDKKGFQFADGSVLCLATNVENG